MDVLHGFTWFDRALLCLVAGELTSGWVSGAFTLFALASVLVFIGVPLFAYLRHVGDDDDEDGNDDDELDLGTFGKARRRDLE